MYVNCVGEIFGWRFLWLGLVLFLVGGIFSIGGGFIGGKDFFYLLGWDFELFGWNIVL